MRLQNILIIINCRLFVEKATAFLTFRRRPQFLCFLCFLRNNGNQCANLLSDQFQEKRVEIRRTHKPRIKNINKQTRLTATYSIEHNRKITARLIQI